MTKPVIMLDLDDTIGHLKYGLVSSLNKETGLNHDVNDIVDYYNITELYGITDECFFSSLEKHNALEKMLPKDNAKEIIDKWAEYFYIHIITARAWHDKGETITKEWLVKHDIHYDFLDVSVGNKSDYFIDSEYIFAFDDGIHNCVDIQQSEKVSNVILISEPWNQSDDSFVRASTFEEMDELIDQWKGCYDTCSKRPVCTG